MDFWTSPLADFVNSLMDEGREVYIWGISADGRRALVVDLDNDRVSVATPEAGASLGRWECSHSHLWANVRHYWDRFPGR